MSQAESENVTEMPRISERLREKQRQTICRAEEYRKEHGNPVDNLVTLFDEIIWDAEVWQEIVDEPYG
jgi:hypothetical protein